MKSSAMTNSMTIADLVVDSSAIVAILMVEPDAGPLRRRLRQADYAVVSAANYVECGLVLSRRDGVAGVERLRAFVDLAALDVASVDAAQAQTAIDAHLRFGRGRHPAKLNYGDCFAYALAKTLDAPLLFKGDDFARTDVASAL